MVWIRAEEGLLKNSEDGAASQEDKRKTSGKMCGSSEGGHADVWCGRGGWRDRVRWRRTPTGSIRKKN